MRPNKITRLTRAGLVSPCPFQEFEVEESPECKLHRAIIKRGLMDYWLFWNKAKRRPLNHIDSLRFTLVKRWLFENHENDYSFEEVAERICKDPDYMVEKIRNAARNDTEKLKVWSRGINEEY